MGFLLMAKMISARTRIWPIKGHYMGLKMGLFWQTGDLNGFIFERWNRAVLWVLFCRETAIRVFSPTTENGIPGWVGFSDRMFT
jgi:hypothetical protein